MVGLCLREKWLDNATVLFGSKAPLLLLWPRHESHSKVQAREISTLKMSSDEKGGCKKCKFYCLILVPGLMKGAKELCYHALFKGISNNLITLLYTYGNQRHKTCWQKGVYRFAISTQTRGCTRQRQIYKVSPTTTRSYILYLDIILQC